jgi:formylmethanofuran dehydrogenase subunit E-like metal-binding protein
MIKKLKGGENVQKNIIVLTFTLILAASLMGSVSAADTQVVGTSTDPQQIGTIVAQNATGTSALGLNTSDSNLLITTAGTAHLNGKTTEDSVQAVVDNTNKLSKDSQKITYGSGNLLTVNNPNGPLEFTFISKTGKNLIAQKYSVSQSGTITTTGPWNIGTNQNSAQLQQAIQALGSNGYDLVAIANLWAQGAPADLLATTYSTGTVNQGTLINYAITRQFEQNYPGANLGTDSWSGTVSNYIFASSGTQGIDSAIYGDYGFSYYYRILNGGDSSKIAIMQYAANTTSGLIAVMQLNDLKNIYSNIYGPVTSGTLSELLFNNWLYNNYLVSNHANQLYSVVMLKQVDEAAYNYLWFDKALGYGHGLDEAYIAKLPNLGGSFDQSQNVIPVTDVAGMKQLGQQAFDNAWKDLGYTSQEAFISDIKAGKVGVITLPYYYNVMKNGVLTSLAGFMDGVNYLNVFSTHNLLPVSSHVNYGWDSVQALFMHVTNLDPNNSSNTVIATSVQTFLNTPAEGTDLPNWGGIKGTKIAWAQQSPYDYLITLSRVGCRCSAQDYSSAVWGMQQYPLGPNEYYQVISLSGYSQMDSARTTIMGVSPSLGTYLTPGSSNDAKAAYILIRWNSVTNTGTAALIYCDGTILSNIQTADGYSKKAGYNWFVDKVLGNPEHISSALSVYREIPLTAADRTALTSSNDPVSFIKNFVIPPTPVNPVNPVSPVTPSNSGTSTQTSVLTGIGATALNAVNGLNSLTTGTSTAASEVAPGLTTSPSTTPAAGKSTATNNGSNLPLGAAAGAIIIAIAAVLIYLGRNTITGAIKGQKSEKLGK